jgi:hypothetical protein
MGGGGFRTRGSVKIYVNPDLHKRIKVFLTQTLITSFQKVDPGFSSRNTDPMVKKAPYPGSGSATLAVTMAQ